MQGARKLRSEAYLQVRCNDEVEAQRRRWTFYETIIIDAPVAQLDRASDFESAGRPFEPGRARQLF
jgi:hypothetical protein